VARLPARLGNRSSPTVHFCVGCVDKDSSVSGRSRGADLAKTENQPGLRRPGGVDTLTMDLADPRKGVLVGRKSPYPAEFRNDAVALYRAAGGKRTYAAVAADVGVTGETLRSWVRQADEQAGRGNRDEPVAEGRDEELARLRAENGRLRRAEKEWELEREILRRAAQYFAKEMRA
jgi:transposase